MTAAADRVTDAQLQAWLEKSPETSFQTPDGTVPGLFIRVGPNSMTWSLLYRVKGEGGVASTGRKKNGRQKRLHIGEYPAESIEDARSKAFGYLAQAKRGVDPRIALSQAATADGLLVKGLAKVFIEDHVKIKELKSLERYQHAIDVHIVPALGQKPATLLTRDEVFEAVKKALIKRPRGDGPRDRPRGGKEAARTMVTVGRSMFTWGITERKINRGDNPFSNMEKNLPKKGTGQRPLTLLEAQQAWDAACDIGYPFGPVYQLDALTGHRRIEWATCKISDLHLDEGLHIIPAEAYKSGHVHVVPLVPEAVNILKWTLAHHYPTKGEYLFSGTDGEKPISGWSKAQSRLLDAICANTGSFPRRWTPHAIRKFVATCVAEDLGMNGDKLVKRILGHSDTGVTSLYNQYGYIREVRRCLMTLADKLLTGRRFRYRLPDSGAVDHTTQPEVTQAA